MTLYEIKGWNTGDKSDYSNTKYVIAENKEEAIAKYKAIDGVYTSIVEGRALCDRNAIIEQNRKAAMLNPPNLDDVIIKKLK